MKKLVSIFKDGEPINYDVVDLMLSIGKDVAGRPRNQPEDIVAT